MSWKTLAAQQDRRHIVAISGGKDSSALAVYLRNKIPSLEYVFCDTRTELPETYTYLDKLEEFLGKKILRLHSDQGFDYYLKMFNGVLPDSKTRWCTRMLKLKPYEQYIGDDPVVSYVGIRADEPHRKGYITSKPNVTTVFPFFEEGLVKEDIFRILEEAGIGLPDYYKWRSRSGCYFCFFQQKREWIGLFENHPDLYAAAQAYEKFDPETGERFTWCDGESLAQMCTPERSAQIKKEYAKRQQRESQKFKSNQRLADMWGQDEDDGIDLACSVCHI